MTASFSSSTRLVNTNAELAPMARTSSTVNSSQPGLRPPRRLRAPRDRTVMGVTVPAGCLCTRRQAAAIRLPLYSGAGSPFSVGSPGDRQQCCSHSAATTSAKALIAATTAPGVSAPATRNSERRGTR